MWGQQTERNWGTWAAVANSGEFTRGFTMHEHLKDLGLIHMNGRVYDPLIGRFLSADPHIQAPGDLQNYNRYSYVNNNPLSFTDPTGFFLKKLFKKIGRFFKKYWRVIVTIAVAIVAAHYAGIFFGKFLAGPLKAAAAGAVGGFAGGVTGSLLHGGSLSNALKSGLSGAFWGAISAGIANKIGGWAKDIKWVEKCRHLLHGLTQGIVSELRGNGFLSGFFSGFASSYITHTEFVEEWEWGRIEFGIAGAITGGTAEVIGGGKFENGAVTGAFIGMYNAGGIIKRMTIKVTIKDM